VDIIQNPNCLYFKNDDFMYQDIREIFTYDDTIVHNPQTLLLIGHEPRFPQFMNQRVLIYFLQKPAA